MLKPIDTSYANHLFRSRLEARWAFYFDTLNVSWEYEKEGFELGNGERYLPDFYLPLHRLYAEVKPTKFSYKEHSKCKRLAAQSECNVIELVGLPSVNPFTVIMPYKKYVCTKCGFEEQYDSDKKRVYCACKAKHKIVTSIHESEAILLLHSDKPTYNPLYFTTYMDDYSNDKVIQKAIKLATEKRFEFQ